MTLRQGRVPGFEQYRLPLLFAFAAVSVVAWGCRTVPVTGRKALVLVPEAEETQLGITAYQDVLTKEPPSKKQRYVEMVRRVGERIAAVSGRKDFAWEFNVIESDQKNAFCLPGGKVAVYEGIIPVCESEAGLAVVMSHEIAHALARHGGERMSQAKARDMGGAAIDYVGHWWKEEAYDSKREVVQAAYGMASEYGAILPYSRKHETEADLIGLKLMAEAGYDPREAPVFWERFGGSKAGEQTWEFASTHPSDARRAADLRAALEEAMKLYEAAPHQYGKGESVAVVESTNLTMPLVSDTRRQ